MDLDGFGLPDSVMEQMGGVGRPKLPERSSNHHYKLKDLLQQGIPIDSAAEIMLAPDQRNADFRFNSAKLGSLKPKPPKLSREQLLMHYQIHSPNEPLPKFMNNYR